MILLALGSNVGAREDFLQRAIEALKAQDVVVVAVSSIMETPALLPEAAPKAWDTAFLNQVIAVYTSHSPAALLALVKSIEAQLGRQDRGRWGPREIDIDLIAYEDRQISMETLTLPHPGLASRDFVLKPLMEIAPQWRHPATGKTAAEMLKELP